jgi:hypothetical protein
MSVRREIAEYDGLYFITFTCCRWLKLFEITNMHSSAKYYATGEQGHLRGNELCFAGGY